MKLKSLFSTPKKAVLTSICIAAILAVTGTATVFAAEGIAKSTSIGTTAAEDKALTDAGVEKANAMFSKTDFEFEKGSFVYEVEFTAEGIEYNYLIKASDGTVLHRKAKVDDSYYPQGTPTLDSTTPPVQAQDDIGLEAAKSKALADAGVNAFTATFTKQKKDWDNGLAVYDLEFYTADKEYDYEINAKTGAVHEKSVENRKRPQQPQTGGDGFYIGIEKAKSIALSHAGLSAGEVLLTKAKFENDDGIMVYEVEFRKGRMEYEYTIHAVSGKILEFDSEYDD